MEIRVNSLCSIDVYCKIQYITFKCIKINAVAYPKYIKARYTQMVNNFLKEYIVINEIVKQK